jgi:hypothetical protein
MHSRRHRRERQRIAANKFRQRNGRRVSHNGRPVPHNGDYVTPAEAWRNHIAWCRFFAKAQRQAQKIAKP